jgi:hypothetical protein
MGRDDVKVERNGKSRLSAYQVHRLFSEFRMKRSVSKAHRKGREIICGQPVCSTGCQQWWMWCTTKPREDNPIIMDARVVSLNDSQNIAPTRPYGCGTINHSTIRWIT